MASFVERPPRPKKSLVPREIESWLHEHIPYRLVGGIALTPIAQEWDLSDTPLRCTGGFQFVCLNYATLQGQRAAIRWLIEFVGIQRAKSGQPCQSRAATEQDQTDCGIWLLPNGKNMLDSHPAAQLLADTWKGCTQAISHPTVGTNHPDVELPQITEALRAIIQFLQETIYRESNVAHVVHDYCRKRHIAMRAPSA